MPASMSHLLSPLLASLTLGLPADAFEHTIMTDDGVGLHTVVYRPIEPGQWPTLLVRTPYGAADDVRWRLDLAERGIAYVVQEMRGTRRSGGVFCFHTCDGRDGATTIAWIVDQPWSNGIVVMTGTSSPGMAALQVAPHDPPGLVAIAAGLAHGDQYASSFPGGVFKEIRTFGWMGSVVNDASALEIWASQFGRHPVDDAFWSNSDAIEAAPRVQVPVFHATGWYDFGIKGALDAYLAFTQDGGEGAAGHQHLTVDPFGHSTEYVVRGDAVLYGDIEMPATVLDPQVDLDRARGIFREHYLGVADPGALAELPQVIYWVFGNGDDFEAPGHEWRTDDRWPPPSAPIRLHLHADGALREACPEGEASPTTYVHDPLDPVPTVRDGLRVTAAGPFDQAQIEARSDVVEFTTPELDAPLEVIGRVRARLFVELDAPDADLVVRMTDVYPDGRSILLREGPLRLAARAEQRTLQLLEPGEIVQARFDVGDVAVVLDVGHRLRFTVASSSHPEYFVNPGDGTYYGQEGELRSVRVSLHHTEARPSYFEVPMPGRGDDEVTNCDPAPLAGPGADDGSSGGGQDGAGTGPTHTTEGDEGATDTTAVSQDHAEGCSCRSDANGWKTAAFAAAWFLFWGMGSLRRSSAPGPIGPLGMPS